MRATILIQAAERARAARMQLADAESMLRAAVCDALDEKLPVQEIAKAVGVTRQRIYQIRNMER